MNEPPAKRMKTINTTGNNQVGEGNTQVVTGATTNNYITNNYQFHIENYHQNGNEPFYLTKKFQLKSGDQPTSSNEASTQTQGSAEEGRCSCQSSLESDVITTNKRNSPIVKNRGHILVMESAESRRSIFGGIATVGIWRKQLAIEKNSFRPIGG